MLGTTPVYSSFMFVSYEHFATFVHLCVYRLPVFFLNLLK